MTLPNLFCCWEWLPTYVPCNDSQLEVCGTSRKFYWRCVGLSFFSILLSGMWMWWLELGATWTMMSCTEYGRVAGQESKAWSCLISPGLLTYRSPHVDDKVLADFNHDVFVLIRCIIFLVDLSITYSQSSPLLIF